MHNKSPFFHTSSDYNYYKTINAFTIVELLVVIVVIGILAAITIISYSGIRNRATIATLQSDLSNASKQIEIYRIENDVYPNGVTDCPTPSAGNICISPSNGNSISSYTVDNTTNPPSYSLIIDNESSGLSYETGQGDTTEVAIGWKIISAGYDHTCAIGPDNLAYCWGDHSSSQLGSDVVADDSNIIVAEVKDSAYDSYGIVAMGGLEIKSLIAVPVDTSGVLSGKTIKSISASYHHTCAIASDDQAYCWGQNGSGELGNDSTVTNLFPVSVDTSGVLSGLTIKSISLGENHTCAIASDNQAYCWGYNYNGRLGDGSAKDSSVPIAISTSGLLSGLTIKSISTGGSHTCAIASDDQAYCWGRNSDGQLGDGSTTERSVPVAVDTSGELSGLTVKSISAGSNHTCVIASDDQAYCWGYGSSGRLGNGFTTSSSIPVAVSTSGVLSSLTIKSISASVGHTCVIASDDQAYCWGWGEYGRLGDATTNSRYTPVAVDTSGLLNGLTIESISAGGEHSCVIASDDQAYCWGYNYYGELGNNSSTDSLVPVQVVEP